MKRTIFLTAFSLHLLACIVSSAAEAKKPLPFILDMVHENLGEPPRISEFIKPQKLADWGYNGQYPQIYVQCTVNFDSLEKGIIPAGSTVDEWMKQKAAIIDKRIAEANKTGIKLYPFTDFLIIPRAVYEKYQQELGRYFRIKKPMVQKVIRAQVDEIFKRYPDLGGLTLRFGETALHDTPHHVGTRPVWSPADHTILINILREEICVKRNKMLFYRTWDFGNNFHTNPEYYCKAHRSGIKNKERRKIWKPPQE